MPNNAAIVACLAASTRARVIREDDEARQRRREREDSDEYYILKKTKDSRAISKWYDEYMLTSTESFAQAHEAWKSEQRKHDMIFLCTFSAFMIVLIIVLFCWVKYGDKSDSDK